MPVRKISHSHPEFISIIYKLADKCNINLTDYVVVYGCEDVDSFVRGIYRLRLTGNRDGQKIKLDIVMKWHPDPKTRASLRDAYRREFVFYRHIIPQLLEIQRNFKNIEGLKIKFPNCVFASIEYDKEVLAVQKISEFSFRDRFHKMDLQHVSLVLKHLAKLHALSFALARNSPKKFREIKELCSKDVQYGDPGPVPSSMKYFYEASVNVILDTAIKKKMKDFGPNILTALYKCTQSDNYSAICHADCWNNNVGFKYKGERPVEVIFIDYQMARIASPVTDISYFLYMSTDHDFIKKHYYHVLDVYYGTLAAVLRQCNLDVNEIYPQSIFQKHLSEYTVLGLIESLVSMMIITAENEEALRMTELKHEDTSEIFCENEKQVRPLFVERVNGIVSDFFEKNYSLHAILLR
ncbi:unnamed protein product [Arctia plantaginis]|uniref:CHK kinase-like domain-containing protein n=1 Tax=Arctia plantaginis TaxID=874455 RepID=A0A8S1BW67_ARCPL|nr:unnamed protein product [Arctia plantaginis]